MGGPLQHPSGPVEFPRGTGTTWHQLLSGGGGGFFDLDSAVNALYDRLRNLPPPSEAQPGHNLRTTCTPITGRWLHSHDLSSYIICGEFMN